MYSVILLVSCDIGIDMEPTSGTTVIRGKVIDTDSKEPISNVELILTYSAFMGMTMPAHIYEYTDDNGSFNFEYYCEKDYSYTLSCEKNAFSNTSPYYYFIEKGEDNYFLIEMVKDSVKVTIN